MYPGLRRLSTSVGSGMTHAFTAKSAVLRSLYKIRLELNNEIILDLARFYNLIVFN